MNERLLPLLLTLSVGDIQPRDAFTATDTWAPDTGALIIRTISSQIGKQTKNQIVISTSAVL